MAEQKKIDKIIFGNKDFSVYLCTAIYELSKRDEITLSAIGHNIGNMERVIRLIKDLSRCKIVEVRRGIETHNDCDAIVTTLQREKT